MSASSAKGPLSAKNTAPRQLGLDGVANPATASLSPRVDSVKRLASSLNLSINLHLEGDGQWLRLILEDELNLETITADYPIRVTTLDRRYHLREAVVIGMRRLVGEAFDRGMISDYPGELLILPTQSRPEPAVPMPTPWEDDFTVSLTDLGSL